VRLGVARDEGYAGVALLRRSMIVVGIARTKFLAIGLGSVAGFDVSA
jgi:hypothetical protein